ncbi:antitoxin [Acidovorax sp. LjRoot129]|uniref:AbrB/MazE/SpoVT family DNA-binding domain-containing protein n=1 Tax=Acidovorax sp. LjRoot129 TaxID=3342260 RepID=UPI003ECFF0D4
MPSTNLRQVGGSVMMAVPRAFLDQLHLAPGASVDLTLDGGRIVVEPKPAPRYTLEDLIAVGPVPARTAEDEAWLSSAPVGKELI